MQFKKLTEQSLAGKRVLIRVDMNVPVKNGVIGDDTRIRASLPSILHCLKAGASVILMTHLAAPPKASRSRKTASPRWPGACPSCWRKR